MYYGIVKKAIVFGVGKVIVAVATLIFFVNIAVHLCLMVVLQLPHFPPNSPKWGLEKEFGDTSHLLGRIPQPSALAIKKNTFS